MRVNEQTLRYAETRIPDEPAAQAQIVDFYRKNLIYDKFKRSTDSPTSQYESVNCQKQSKKLAVMLFHCKLTDQVYLLLVDALFCMSDKTEPVPILTPGALNASAAWSFWVLVARLVFSF